MKDDDVKELLRHLRRIDASLGWVMDGVAALLGVVVVCAIKYLSQ